MAETAKNDAPEVEDEWEELSATVFKFEDPGDTFEGVYIGNGEQMLDGKIVTRHDAEDETGPRFFWGSTTLDGSLAAVNRGDTIRIVFTGLTDKKYQGGNPAKLYSVARRRTY